MKTMSQVMFLQSHQGVSDQFQNLLVGFKISDWQKIKYWLLIFNYKL